MPVKGSRNIQNLIRNAVCFDKNDWTPVKGNGNIQSLIRNAVCFDKKRLDAS